MRCSNRIRRRHSRMSAQGETRSHECAQGARRAHHVDFEHEARRAQLVQVAHAVHRLQPRDAVALERGVRLGGERAAL
eukprot:3156158-Prymnesium_polylepis.2